MSYMGSLFRKSLQELFPLLSISSHQGRRGWVEGISSQQGRRRWLEKERIIRDSLLLSGKEM